MNVIFGKLKLQNICRQNDFISDTDLTHPWLSKQTSYEGAVIQLLQMNKLQIFQ